jgi:hypothetical protein
LRGRDRLRGGLDREVPAGDHDRIGDRDDLVERAQRLVLLDLGDDRHRARAHRLAQARHVVGTAHE